MKTKTVAVIKDYGGKVDAYFNPIGTYYLKFVLIFRLLLVNVFVMDIFKNSNITCETKQIGCELSCKNRFSPIDHAQLWNFELLTTSLALMVFVAVNLLNQNAYESLKLKHSKADSKEFDDYLLKYTTFRHKKGRVHSAYTVIGYSAMLVIRLILEILCLYIETQLAQHHSQKEDNVFDLNEKWFCLINGDYSNGVLNNLEHLPASNRSALFHRDDTINACEQQLVAVTCWIKDSRMKTLGLYVMISVLALQTFLTALELFVEVCKMFMGESGLRPRKDRLAEDCVAGGAAEHGHGVVELLQQLHLSARRRRRGLKEIKKIFIFNKT